MRITQDKLNETRYHFHRLKEMLESIKNADDFSAVLQPIEYFRYEINSFVNSHRATTFALQSEHKSALGDKFVAWYDKALRPLTSDDFSKILKELRNINQKEGNLYPKFEFKCELPESIFYAEIDFVDTNDEFIKITGFEAKKKLEVRISDTTTEGFGTLTQEDEIKIWNEANAFFREQRALMVKSTNFVLHRLTIDRFNKKYSAEEFLENLNRVGKLLQDMVEDGWKFLK